MDNVSNITSQPNEKDQAVENFFKGLRISFNYISLYSKEHKTFFTAVDELKKKIELLSHHLSPIVIGITAEALYIDSVEYSKSTLHKELAKIFHQRKIKSIEINPNITIPELVFLLDKISLPIKDILKSGGWKKIMSSNSSIKNFLVQELDYSALLSNESGEDAKDIWAFLLNDAVQNNDERRIGEFVDNFEGYIDKFGAGSFLNDEHLEGSLREFFQYLKKTNSGNYRKCGTAFLKAIIKNKDSIKEESLNRLKTLVKDLDVNDYSNIVWDKITADENFDAYGFELFTKLLDNDTNASVADDLANKKKAFVNAQSVKKIKELLSFDSSMINQVYRQALASIVKDKKHGAEIVFDENTKTKNYMNILLTILDLEDGLRRFEVTIERISKDWNKIVEYDNAEYFKFLISVLMKKEVLTKNSTIVDDFSSMVYSYVENKIWVEDTAKAVFEIVQLFPKSVLGLDVYIRKFFIENKVNQYSFKLFLKFFPDKMDLFYDSLIEKKMDFDFFASVIKSLSLLEKDKIANILMNVYSLSHDLIRIEILNYMKQTKIFDAEFLLNLLANASVSVKKEVLSVLATEEYSRKRAFKLLLDVQDFWGVKNDLVIENIDLIDDLNSTDSWDYLKVLSKKPFFWNKRVRERAKKAMERLKNNG